MQSRDIIVIGSGVAGMSAAGYAARAGRSVMILESFAAGGQCMYIADVENYPGLTEPISGFEFGERFETQAKKFGAETTSAEVKAIRKENDRFIVQTNDGDWEAKAVIIATGAKHRKMDVPGEEDYQGKGVSYCGTCDGPLFRGKRILVVGGGDTALTDALYLSQMTKDLTICHRKDRFRAQENLVSQISCKQIATVMDTTVSKILGDGKHVTGVELTSTKDGSSHTMDVDGVFIFVGMIPQTAFLDKAILDSHGYVVTDRNMQTSVPGLFAAGDVRDTPFRQLVTAASDGAIAAHAASEYIDFIDGHPYR
ncbi:MAG: thioredoxin-disulfide reductase [Sphaerochaeta sp.]|jgi:thioredoxin reductase (NADPH)|nr:thioredoxin-disulfide reductase [Sphaerochaeta sp.]MCI2045281.1 thioredoxin-disulfide reductase [Sphaerochaeta sp.]MCI2076964.1 thioredoxin-disulfide reductase [Sphaerochaeta sp.]MCI2097025.1 thioredoxin-disulfide reductase [Sphaerochaeta sp.]MCI2103831.1 thioredoxin-disulfide reductase [Sphaerochaeta sp.]